jgi:hypothetical protein
MPRRRVASCLDDGRRQGRWLQGLFTLNADEVKFFIAPVWKSKSFHVILQTVYRKM